MISVPTWLATVVVTSLLSSNVALLAWVLTSIIRLREYKSRIEPSLERLVTQLDTLATHVTSLSERVAVLDALLAIKE